MSLSSGLTKELRECRYHMDRALWIFRGVLSRPRAESLEEWEDLLDYMDGLSKICSRIFHSLSSEELEYHERDLIWDTLDWAHQFWRIVVDWQLCLRESPEAAESYGAVALARLQENPNIVRWK